jgi:hypothetical protein
LSPTPEGTSRWLQTLLPIAQQGGPVVSLLLAVVMTISLWWMGGWLRECIEHNRALGAQLVSQQEKYHTEILLRLAHCPPPR